MSLFDSASLIVTPNGVKEDKLYSIKPTDGSGDLVVTRATTATRVNSDGLIEQVPYNFITYSEQFDNSSWTKSNGASITANSTIAPNGTLTADTLTVATSTYSGIYQNVGSLSGQNTISIYAKKATKDFLYFINLQGSTTVVWFNISNGTLGTVSSGYTATITDVGNGWYHCTLSQSVTGTSYFRLGLSDSDGSVIPTSSGTAYIWGAQLNNGSSAKEYFPTTDRLDVPRLDYTNSSCPSILVEPQRTNTVLNSNNSYQNGVNGSSSTTTIQSIISGVNYRKMTATAVDGYIYCDASSLSSSPTGLMCFSIFLKKGTCDDIQLIDQNTTGKSIRVNLNNGSIISQSSGLVCGVQPYSDNVYRIFIVQDYTSIGFRYDLYAKEIGDFYYIGAQFESGSYPTSLIPTNGTSVTRNADVISKTGISSLIGQTEGVLYAEVIIKNTENQICASIQRDGNINHIFISQFNNKPTFSVRKNNTTIFSYSNGVFLNGINKVALAYNTNGIISAFLNGVKVSTISTSAFTFSNTLNSLQISDDGYYSLQNTTNNKATILFKTALTDDECINLTTI